MHVRCAASLRTKRTQWLLYESWHMVVRIVCMCVVGLVCERVDCWHFLLSRHCCFSFCLQEGCGVGKCIGGRSACMNSQNKITRHYTQNPSTSTPSKPSKPPHSPSTPPQNPQHPYPPPPFFTKTIKTPTTTSTPQINSYLKSPPFFSSPAAGARQDNVGWCCQSIADNGLSLQRAAQP